MSYKDFPKSVRLNKIIFDITKFVFALLVGLVFEIFLVVLCLVIKIATLIAAYISYKINDMFYYSYIKILIDNTKICYCKKLDIFIKYDEDVNNPLYEWDRATPGMGYYRYDEETDDFVEVKDFLKGINNVKQ